MKKLILLAFLLPNFLFAQERKEIGNLVVENIPNIPADLVERMNQYQNTRSASFSDWDSAGKGIFISTRFGDVNQLHHVAAPGGYRRQITYFKEPIGGASVCPDKSKNGFIFIKDNGGDENFQINYYDLNTGKWELWTDGKSRNSYQGWNERGDKIVFTSNRRNGADMDLYMQSFGTNSNAKMLLELKGGGWGVSDWSSDDKLMVLGNYKSVNESELYLMEVATGKMERINPKNEPISYGNAIFSLGNKGIFYTSDEGTEFNTLRYYDIASKQSKSLTNGINWDVSNVEMSKDKKRLVFSTNEGGYTKLYVMDTKKMTFKAVPNLPKGSISGMNFSDDGTRLGITMVTATSVADAYSLDMKTQKTTRWTFSEMGGLNPASFVEPTLFEYPTFDQVSGKTRMIPAFIYVPKNVKGKVPVLMNIHGGPEGQSVPVFAPLTQFMVNELGIAVVYPNVRGSTGYGKTYVKLDNGYLREDSVKDIGSLLDWISKQANLDSERVGVYGGSYGGYMSLASMTHFNDRLRCGVDLFGISNFNTFLKNTGAYRVDLRRVEYGDERDPKMSEFLEKISPMTNLAKITKPMLIYQGKNDPRVPLSESEQAVATLKTQGTKVWYIMAKDEGHSLAKKNNRDYTNAATILFLQDNLLK